MTLCEAANGMAFAIGIAMTSDVRPVRTQRWLQRGSSLTGKVPMDIVLTSHWRVDDKIVSLRAPGGREVTDSPRSQDSGFVWRRGKVEILLSRDGDAWRVSQTTSGRLFGPRQMVYEQRHKLVRPAALDFMARVIRESKNEEEGIRVARAASRWMNGERQS